MADVWDPDSRTNRRPIPGDPLKHVVWNVERINMYNKLMGELADDLGTEYDTQDLRDRLATGRKATTALIKESSAIMRKPVQSGERDMHAKLKTELQRATGQFQGLSRECLRKERQIVVQMQHDSDDGFGAHEEQEQGLQLEFDDAQGIDEVDRQIIEERNAEIREIEKEMGELADVYKDVGTLVQAQGEQIDQADRNMEVTEQNIEYARENLKEGERLAVGYRKRMLIIVIIIVVVIVIAVGAGVGWACSPAGPLNC